jgi:hypothetical protein
MILQEKQIALLQICGTPNSGWKYQLSMCRRSPLDFWTLQVSSIDNRQARQDPMDVAG